MSVIKSLIGLSVCAALYISCDWLIKDNEAWQLDKQKEKAESMIAEIIAAFKSGGVSPEVKEIMVHMKPVMLGAKRVLTESNYVRYTAAVRVMAAEQTK